jgi:capsule polysaccharide export protein KpsE/RkpR
VTDHDPHRAAEIGNAYIDELNSLVADLSTSAAHRERVFLEERLKVAKVEMDEAANQLAQFSSKNTTLDIQSEGRAMLDAASSIAGQLIAAQSQLEGLRQIYTDNNPRVRTLNGRVAELRRELQKFGGTEQSTMGKSTNQLGPDPLTSGNPPLDKGSSSPFPTIKNLPLLGAKYTDYYQRAKIQETVVEMLTEQYELAKVQEAKDTPSVKVLDPAVVPERKSFPPHLLIMASGTVLIFIITAVWLLAVNTWERIDPNDPRKSFALEVAATVRASAPWASQNGDAPHSWTQRFWDRLKNSRSDRSPDL